MVGGGEGGTPRKPLEEHEMQEYVLKSTCCVMQHHSSPSHLKLCALHLLCLFVGENCTRHHTTHALRRVHAKQTGVSERHETVQEDQARPFRASHREGEAAGQGRDTPPARQVRGEGHALRGRARRPQRVHEGDVEVRARKGRRRRRRRRDARGGVCVCACLMFVSLFLPCGRG